MANTFKLVIFDLGNVVINFDYWRAVNKITKFTPLHPESPAFKSGDEWQIKIKSSRKPHLLRWGVTGFTVKRPEEIFQLFFDSDLTGLFEEGKISPQDFYLRVKDLLNSPISYEEFLLIWNEIFFVTADNLEVHKIIKNLKRSYFLTMISNIDTLHHHYLKENFAIFGQFDKIILSYEVGLRKPQPIIYQMALDAAGAKPAEAIYTDDRLELVESARKLGIKSFHFQGAGILKGNLRELGIIL